MSYLDTYNKNDFEELKNAIKTDPKKDNIVRKKLDKLNLSVIGEGANRVVVSNPKHNYVIKFRKEEYPNTQNKQEVETYNKFQQENISKILVPVIEHTKNFDIVVQQKIDQSNVDRRDILKISALLIYEYGYYTGDINKTNIGMYKNDGVDILSILDWGEGIRPIKNTEFENKHEAFDSIIDTIYIKI